MEHIQWKGIELKNIKSLNISFLTVMNLFANAAELIGVKIIRTLDLLREGTVRMFRLGDLVFIRLPLRCGILIFHVQKKILYVPVYMTHKAFDLYKHFVGEPLPTAVEGLTGRVDPTNAEVLERYDFLKKIGIGMVRRKKAVPTDIDGKIPAITVNADESALNTNETLNIVISEDSNVEEDSENGSSENESSEEDINDDTAKVMDKSFEQSKKEALADLEQPITLVKKYQDEIRKWAEANEKKITSVYAMVSKEDHLAEKISLLRKELKLLQLQREVLSSYANNDFIRTVKKEMVTRILSEDSGNMWDEYDQLEMLNESSNIKFPSYTQVEDANISNYLGDSIVSSTEDLPTVKKRSESVTNKDLQKAIQMLSEENTFMKSHLSKAQDKLEDILIMAEKINSEVECLNSKFSDVGRFTEDVPMLKQQIEEGQKILEIVTKEKNEMEEKLRILDSMVAEEQDFLDRLGSSNQDILAAATADLNRVEPVFNG